MSATSRLPGAARSDPDRPRASCADGRTGSRDPTSGALRRGLAASAPSVVGGTLLPEA